jgi:cyclic pyranopterin phosphate synthase
MEKEAFGSTAERFRYLDGQGEVGVIQSVTRPFCGECTRARLSAAGQLYTCLFASEPRLDVRQLLRAGATDAEITAAISKIWENREDRYSELRGRQTGPALPKVEMSYIGG